MKISARPRQEAGPQIFQLRELRTAGRLAISRSSVTRIGRDIAKSEHRAIDTVLVKRARTFRAGRRANIFFSGKKRIRLSGLHARPCHTRQTKSHNDQNDFFYKFHHDLSMGTSKNLRGRAATHEVF